MKTLYAILIFIWLILPIQANNVLQSFAMAKFLPQEAWCVAAFNINGFVNHLREQQIIDKYPKIYKELIAKNDKNIFKKSIDISKPAGFAVINLEDASYGFFVSLLDPNEVKNMLIARHKKTNPSLEIKSIGDAILIPLN